MVRGLRWVLRCSSVVALVAIAELLVHIVVVGMDPVFDTDMRIVLQVDVDYYVEAVDGALKVVRDLGDEAFSRAVPNFPRVSKQPRQCPQTRLLLSYYAANWNNKPR